MASKTTKKKAGRSASGARKKSAPAKNTQEQFLASEILIWTTLAVSIILVISNFGLAGFVGERIAGVIQGLFGWVAYVFPILLFGGVSFLVSNKGNSVAYIKTAAAAVLMLLLCVAFQLIDDRGGLVGAAVTDRTIPAVGVAGTWVLTLILMVICVVLITERSVLGGMKKGGAKAYGRAREDLQRHQETARVRREQKARLQQERQEPRRTDHAVSGVSFDTTLGVEKPGKGRETAVPEAEAAQTIRAEKKEERSRKNAKSQQKQQTQQTSQGASLEDVVINRSMPLSARELIPEPETEPAVPAAATDVADGPADSGAQSVPEEPARTEPARKRTTAAKSGAAEAKEQPETVEISSVPTPPEYRIPPLSLLKRGQKGGGDSDAHLRETAMKLQKTLETFGVNVTITNISCGPAVTRYELQPELGVKVSKIVGLADDIKLNLAAADIRIEAPIPGKAAVGIEVPNKENTAVMLRDLLESEEFQKSPSKISFATGRDIGGKVVVSDIAKMPHVLVAGATGSGKSVCINTLIMSILYKARPDEVKLIMVDPKVVELSVYNGIPHLMIPVVTDPKKAAGALNWAVAEMDRRYQLMAEYNVRDLKSYNAKVEQIQDIDDPAKPQKLPQIVIIVDELADLMMVAPGEVEEAICRLAQLARAAGLHLVLATQRPSVNVITGLIKANMPSRIAFAVSSGVDSRTIIDMNGAEKLLGKGDMLFYPSGYPKPIRVQGAFVSDKEVQAVVDYLKEQNGQTTYDEEIQNQVNNNVSAALNTQGGAPERDAYFAEAGKFIIEKDKASIGMLQRVFKIGFNRAARIMDQLAEAGVVGEEEGTKPRKVLMSMEEFEQYIEEYV